MADGFTVDDSEIRKLAADLGNVPARAIPELEKSVLRSALDVRDAMRGRFKGKLLVDGAARATGDSIAPAVDAERIGSGDEIAYEIGPRVGKFAGSLGAIAVDGGANGGGGTVEIDDLLAPEVAKLEKYLPRIIEEAL